MDDEEILEKLESLLDDDRLESGFETKGELLEWANAVAPLLRFHDEYYRTFQHYNRIINRNVSYVTGEPAFRTMVS